MKKGLITAIGTIALAIAGNGFAVAPTISDVPDVIIGDAEDQPTGSTVDVNFFRLNNALNLMSYIDLGTAPATDLLFAFDEELTGNRLDFTAGTSSTPIQQLTTPSAAPTLWPASERISNALTGSFNLSIRNIALSPRPVPPASDGGPWPAPVDLSDSIPTTISEVALVDQREVTLFVGDNLDNVDSDVITVYSKNASLDSLSGGAAGYTTLFTQTAFPTNGTALYNWEYSQFGFPYSNCTTSTGSGTQTYLGIASAASATTGAAFFGRWWQPGTQVSPGIYNGPIPHIDGNIVYCAKLRLSIEATTNNLKAFAPDIRFGADSAGSNLTTMNLISSQGQDLSNSTDQVNPQIPDLGVANARDYKIYWSPNPAAMTETAHIANLAGADWRRWRLFFDIVDLNSTWAAGQDAGTWKVSYVEVGYVPRPADIAPVAGSSTNFRLTDLTTATGGFATMGFTTAGTSVLQNNPSAGKITVSTAAGAAVAVYQRNNTAPWIAGKILRVTASLSCPTASRANFAIARIRHAGVLPWVSQIFSVRRQAGLEQGALVPYVPLTTATPYECYLPSYGGPNAYINSLVGQIGTLDPRYFVLGIDHVFNGPTDVAMQWTVHNVLYETLDEATQLVP